MILTAVAAIDEALLIGADGDLPWRLPADLRRFKRLTMGHPIVMGRRTWESLPGALPGRDNIVLSRDRDFVAPGAVVVLDVDAALEAAAAGDTDASEVFVIGGRAVYELLLPRLDRLHLTIVRHRFTGDTYFPAFDMSHWLVRSREEFAADEKNPWAQTVFVLERREHTGASDVADRGRLPAALAS